MNAIFNCIVDIPTIPTPKFFPPHSVALVTVADLGFGAWGGRREFQGGPKFTNLVNSLEFFEQVKQNQQSKQ